MEHMGADVWIVLQWWAVLFLVGAVSFPLTKRLFAPGLPSEASGVGWWDGGYFFAKAVGMAVVTYFVYLVGSLHILPFTIPTIVISLSTVFAVGFFLHSSHKTDRSNKTNMMLIAGEELFFFAALLFWAWVKGHEPSIRALEKFMDFGFTKSVLNSLYFPAPDMWYAGGTINYYYFGHVVLAVLTKLSGIDLAYTFNLMLVTIFALTLTMSFSIGVQLGVIGGIWGRRGKIMVGVLTAFLVTLAGNLQTIYAFTRGYTGDPPASGPPPFWQLGWSLAGLERYWYANATRFIPYTIHEFPSYSFVVSDVHGHVLSLPFVFLGIALLILMFGQSVHGEKFQISNFKFQILFYGFLVGILLMTNALDGPIYLGLFVILYYILRATIHRGVEKSRAIVLDFARTIGMVVLTAGLTSLPFLAHFKSFVSGIGVNCPSASAGSPIGPFLFEGVEKCQHSPLWMLLLLWGFFLYCGGWFIFHIKMSKTVSNIEKLLLIFFIFSIGLIIFPEFFYFKDIYPAHFRSNTMFKLGYQAFILFSIVSGYTIMTVKKRAFFLFLLPLLFLVSIYPIFSVRSYFNSLKNYEGLHGLTWFAREYSDDYAAIIWLGTQPLGTLVEADGDSYTDYARFSAFTGLPTIIGWPVHEWLWRGSYDVVSPRREEVHTIYESPDFGQTQALLKKYHVTYIVIGTLERSKYPKLVEEKFRLFAQEAFRSGQTVIYQVQ